MTVATILTRSSRQNQPNYSKIVNKIIIHAIQRNVNELQRKNEKSQLIL